MSCDEAMEVRPHDPVETIGRLGARLILQLALEDAVTESLGRARYERAEETVSHRNGYEPPGSFMKPSQLRWSGPLDCRPEHGFFGLLRR